MKDKEMTRVFLRKSTVNELIQRKRVGDSYDSVIRRLLMKDGDKEDSTEED